MSEEELEDDYWTMRETDAINNSIENKKLKQQIADLEAKLAEKEKELEYYKKQTKKFNNEAQKYYEDAYCNDFHNQDKINFAVEQLTEIRDYVIECWSLEQLEGKVRLDIAKKIRLKIEQLKEGK